MNILICQNSVLPALKYGGTERLIWWLGKQLSQMGHKVSFLAAKGSTCPFAEVLEFQENVSIDEQIPDYIDVVHLNNEPDQPLKKPYIVTIHGNRNNFEEFDLNSVFVSKNHANRYQSEAFVYNGIDLDEYRISDFNKKRTHTHFLAKAAWRLKNVKGAIELAKRSHNKLVVLGGTRLNFKMGFRFTPDLHVRFYGMVGGDQKLNLLSTSKALIFPVLWHEPFGLAIIESLVTGSAVFGTPYGSLPELVPEEVGFLSNSKAELVNQLMDLDRFKPEICREYASDNFSINQTAMAYLSCYEKVLNGRTINSKPPKALEISPGFLGLHE
ncbi:Glycosyl transferases group 1 [Pseudarcicella hirudinis]|uniref:Glycosyl transferases group 1 n=1 Tax=Pseudarcicella hirudinis TaxID=1079859 RepID=A0A1I5X034_9BACT|nr:glycosyltransferase [Pseudarcicella hirudinis]SFQ25329.1 Glycosyl transferases group 1 [Pseudarcicella hirudinis]